MSSGKLELYRLIEDLKSLGEDIAIRPKIDYYDFRDNWLALFNPAATGSNAPMGEWVQAVARGNPLTPVDVFKDGQVVDDEAFPGYKTVVGGEYMFTVPPILNSSVEIKLSSGDVIDNVAIESSHISKRVAALGDRNMENKLISKLQINTDSAPNLAQAMDDIFKHFGIDRNPKKEGTEDADITDIGGTTTDDIDFDF